jgi:hypothetical protein
LLHAGRHIPSAAKDRRTSRCRPGQSTHVSSSASPRSGELVPGERRDHDPRADPGLLPQPRFSNDARRLTRSTGYSRCSTRQATTSTSRAPCGRCAGCPTLSEFWAIGRSVSRQSPDPVGAADGDHHRVANFGPINSILGYKSGDSICHYLPAQTPSSAMVMIMATSPINRGRAARWTCLPASSNPPEAPDPERRSQPPLETTGSAERSKIWVRPRGRSGRWYRPDHPQWIDPFRRCVVESSERQQDDTSRPSRGIGWEMLGMIPQILKRAVALQLWHTAARGIRART